MKKWSHAELAKDLALSFDPVDWMTWIEPQLDNGIPDVYKIKKSFSRRNPRYFVYEIKVTQSDLNGEMKSGKWMKYLSICEKIFFAVPDYLRWRDIVTDKRIGIIVRRENSWHVARQGNRFDVPDLSEADNLRLMMDKWGSTSRFNRLLTEKLALLSNEMKGTRGVVKSVLAVKKWELKQKEYQLSKQFDLEKWKENIRNEVIKEICQEIGSTRRWYGSENIWMNELFIAPLQKTIARSIRNFERLVGGVKKETADELADRLVDEWHDVLDGRQPIWEHLKMNRQEYDTWVSYATLPKGWENRFESTAPQ